MTMFTRVLSRAAALVALALAAAGTYAELRRVPGQS